MAKFASRTPALAVSLEDGSVVRFRNGIIEVNEEIAKQLRKCMGFGRVFYEVKLEIEKEKERKEKAK